MPFISTIYHSLTCLYCVQNDCLSEEYPGNDTIGKIVRWLLADLQEEEMTELLQTARSGKDKDYPAYDLEIPDWGNVISFLLLPVFYREPVTFDKVPGWLAAHFALTALLYARVQKWCASKEPLDARDLKAIVERGATAMRDGAWLAELQPLMAEWAVGVFDAPSFLHDMSTAALRVARACVHVLQHPEDAVCSTPALEITGALNATFSSQKISGSDICTMLTACDLF